MAKSSIGRALRRVRAGDQCGIRNERALATPRRITLTSPAFADGDRIPLAHAGEGIGDNLSPALTWAELPTDTRQLLLLIEDTDVPLPRPLLHTIALLDPAIGSLATGGLAQDDPRIRFVAAGFGRVGYFGPRPLPGHGEHHYGFHLYALDTVIQRDARVAGIRQLLRAVCGHVIGAAHLTGIYQCD